MAEPSLDTTDVAHMTEPSLDAPDADQVAETYLDAPDADQATEASLDAPDADQAAETSPDAPDADQATEPSVDSRDVDDTTETSPDTSDVEQASETSRADGAPMELPRLLLVDDEANILQALRRVLRKSDFEIETTTSPKQALEMLHDVAYAVVVSDQRMPEMDGTVFLEQVRALSPDSVRIMLTGYADIQASIDAINKGAVWRYLNKPWDEDDLRNTVRQGVDQFILVQENRRLKELSDKQNAELKDLNDNLKKRVMERTWEVLRLNQKLEQGFMGAVQAMARMAEMHSTVVGSHSKRVASLSAEIAKRLGLTGRDLSEVEVAATLHDIGKIQTERAILQKEEKYLEPSEKSVLREHPVQGEAIVRLVPNLEDAHRFIRHHHERFDGKGYPDGLAGPNIPLGARIIAAANAYDKALNARPTFGSTTPSQALRLVEARTPSEFDPQIVEALSRVVDDLEKMGENDGEIEIHLKDLRPGMVLAKNLTSSRGQVLLKKNCFVQREQIATLIQKNAVDPIIGGISVYRRWPPRATRAIAEGE